MLLINPKDLDGLSAGGAKTIFSSPRTANLGFLCNNEIIPRVKLYFQKTFFCTKNVIFLLYCDLLELQSKIFAGKVRKSVHFA